MNEGDHDRKQIAVNTHLWLPTVLLAVFCAVSVSCMIEKEAGLCIGFSAAALAALFVFLVSPVVLYVFAGRRCDPVFLGTERGGGMEHDRKHHVFGRLDEPRRGNAALPHRLSHG